MRRRSWTKDQLEAAIRESTTYRAVLKRLNLSPKGGNYRQLRKYIRELGLTTNHFTRVPWNRGLKVPRAQRKTLHDLLTPNSDYGTSKLKKKLFAAQLKSPHCEECGWGPDLRRWAASPRARSHQRRSEG